MKTDNLTTDDGVTLTYAYSMENRNNPWIVLIIPFGLHVSMAEPFFEFFTPRYNICTWESRLILNNSDHACEVEDFSIENHVRDLFAVVDTLDIQEAILVGYCSGAGIALAAVNSAPNRFSELILAHGEYVLLDDMNYVTQFAADMDGLLCLAASSDKRAELVHQKIQSERLENDTHRPEGLDKPFSDINYLKRYAKNYLAYKSSDFERLASDITHPTLLMAGGRDIQVNIKSSEKIRRAISDAEIFIDPEADHYGVLTENSSTLIAIWNYISENTYVRSHRKAYS